MVMVHHHIKYEEIHGVDEVILMEKGEHRRLHNRLRRDGKCNIPPPVLGQVSDKANQRRPEARQRHREYNSMRRQDPTYRELEREQQREYAKTRYAEDSDYRTRRRDYNREYKAKTRTIFPRLRPDIISSAMTPALRTGRA